ncbi:hypothetical protein EYF80_039646 [Liparis tanakae]|uniref:Uncharacterized protein n=1 Tax=Liparis tanakae TaxID=230148 RepID=A0A4Z2G9E1_9TELE|nr:hypothetical protein EYF80_039646 [Liparis tanakae]
MLPVFRQNGDISGDNTESVSRACCLFAANFPQKGGMLQEITFLEYGYENARWPLALDLLSALGEGLGDGRLILLLVGHGHDGQDEVDQVEGAQEDDQHKENHMNDALGLREELTQCAKLRMHFCRSRPMKSCRPMRANTLRQKTVRIITSASFLTDWIKAPTMVFRPRRRREERGDGTSIDW